MAELVDKRSAADYRIVIDYYLAGYLRSVGDDYIIAYDTVVGDMRIGHDEAVGANHGLALCCCAAVYGDTFTYGGIVADDGCSLLSAEFQILRYAGNHSSRENIAVFADTGTVHDHDVGGNACAFTDFNIRLYCHKGVNHHTGMDFGCRMYIS